MAITVGMVIEHQPKARCTVFLSLSLVRQLKLVYFLVFMAPGQGLEPLNWRPELTKVNV
jgi:hypothetical protein